VLNKADEIRWLNVQNRQNKEWLLTDQREGFEEQAKNIFIALKICIQQKLADNSKSLTEEQFEEIKGKLDEYFKDTRDTDDSRVAFHNALRKTKEELNKVLRSLYDFKQQFLNSSKPLSSNPSEDATVANPL
jgi:hypothetical protein